MHSNIAFFFSFCSFALLPSTATFFPWRVSFRFFMPCFLFRIIAAPPMCRCLQRDSSRTCHFVTRLRKEPTGSVIANAAANGSSALRPPSKTHPEPKVGRGTIKPPPHHTGDGVAERTLSQNGYGKR
jgi:hypothetical protein